MPIGLSADELARRAHHQGQLAELADAASVEEMHRELERFYRTQLVAKLTQDRIHALLAGEGASGLPDA